MVGRLEGHVSMTQASVEIGSGLVPLAKVSAIIPASDAEDLRWYFRTGGFGVFAQSPTAALLARLELFGRVASPCQRCGGDPERWTSGTGFEASRDEAPPTEQQRAYLEMLEIEVPDMLPPAGDRLCRDCEGRGWTLPRYRAHSTAPLTARPSASKKWDQAGGVEVDVSDLARLGKVSRRLSAVRAHEAEAPILLAIEAYYSPDGGSLGALWHLVPSGKTMLRTNPQRLPPAQFFANLRAAQSVKPTQKRAAQFKAAEEQAFELFGACGRLWNEIGGRP